MSALLVPKVSLPKVSASPSLACLAATVVSEVTTWYSMLMPVAGRLSWVSRFETLRRSVIRRRSSAIQVAVLPVTIRSRHSSMILAAASSPRASAWRYSPRLLYSPPTILGVSRPPAVLAMAALRPRCSSCMDLSRSIISLSSMVVSFLVSLVSLSASESLWPVSLAFW